MEPNGYTNEIANAIFAVFASGKVGEALDSAARIADELSDIAFAIERLADAIEDTGGDAR